MLGMMFQSSMAIGEHGLTFGNTSKSQYLQFLSFTLLRLDPKLLEIRLAILDEFHSNQMRSSNLDFLKINKLTIQPVRIPGYPLPGVPKGT